MTSKRTKELDLKGACILVFLLGLIAAFGDTSTESVASVKAAVLEGYKTLNGLQWKAVNKLSVINESTQKHVISEEYENIIHGRLATDGKFHVSIKYVSGMDQGESQTIAYDSHLTYIFYEPSGQLFIQRGKRSQLSLLFGAMSPLEPFMFLKPKSFTPQDEGEYLTLDEILNEDRWVHFQSSATWNSAPDSKDSIVAILNDPSVRINFNSVSKLPQRFDIPSVGVWPQQIRTLEWQNLSTQNSMAIPVLKKMVTEVMSEGKIYRLETTISEVSEIKDLSVEDWQVPIGLAKSVTDADEGIIIPSK